MESRKSRPQNGPGTNNLRGGKREFGNKTAIGGWVEANGGPINYQRGFSTEEFISESQSQQSSVAGKTSYFGAGLPTERAFELSTPSIKDKEIFYPSIGPGANTWESTTQAMSIHTKKTIPEQGPKSNLSKEKLAEYRTKWTMDPPEMRTIRFTIDTRNQPALRRLPGTPMGLERLREKLCEKFGVLGLSTLRAALGKGDVTSRKFEAVVASLTVEVSKHDVNTIVVFFMSSSDSFDADEFMRRVVDDSGRIDRSRVQNTFSMLFKSAKRVPVEDVQGMVLFDVSVKLAEALSSVIPVYADGEGLIGVEEFINLHTDMFESVPELYESVTEKLF